MSLPILDYPQQLSSDDVLPAEGVQDAVGGCNNLVDWLEVEHSNWAPRVGNHDVVTVPIGFLLVNVTGFEPGTFTTKASPNIVKPALSYQTYTYTSGGVDAILYRYQLDFQVAPGRLVAGISVQCRWNKALPLSSLEAETANTLVYHNGSGYRVLLGTDANYGGNTEKGLTAIGVIVRGTISSGAT